MINSVKRSCSAFVELPPTNSRSCGGSVYFTSDAESNIGRRNSYPKLAANTKEEIYFKIGLLKELKVAIFDFDNTIANTTIAHYESWVHAVHLVLNKHKGITFFSFEDYFVKYNGFNLQKTIDTLCKNKGIKINDIERNKIIKLKQECFQQSLIDIKPFQQAIELIQYCVDRKLHLAIASGSSQDEIVAILNNGNFEDVRNFFTKEKIIGQGMYKRSKPAPDPYAIGKQTIEQLVGLKFENDECLVIEDADVGILSAMNNNCSTINRQDYKDKLNEDKLRHKVDCMHALNIRELTDTTDHISVLYRHGREIQNRFSIK